MRNKGNNYETFVDLLWKTSKNPLGSALWRFLYWLNYRVAKFYLLRLAPSIHVFLKGSYARGDYNPLISDIDFVAVFSAEDLDEGKKRATFLKKIAPLVKDVECFEEDYFYDRVKYGSRKYHDFSNWKQLDSQKGSRPARFSYPLKNSFDLLQDIFFYVEWIHINLQTKNGKAPSDYRIACAKRACLRALELSDLPPMEAAAKLAHAQKPQEILWWLNGVLQELSEESEVYKKLKPLVKADYFEILNRPYYLERFEIVDGPDFEIEKQKLYLAMPVFSLFYDTGVLDSSLVFEKLTKSEDPILNACLLAEYFQNIQDGKHNELHDNFKDLELTERFEEAKKVLERCQIFHPRRLHGKTVYVTVSWGSGYLKTLSRSHKALKKTFGEELNFLHVSLGGNDAFFESLSTLTTLKISFDSGHENLWHKETLFNVARNFCFGAEKVIFADIDAVIEDPKWLDEVNRALEVNDVVQPFASYMDKETGEKTLSSIAALKRNEETFYAPGLLWAFNSKGMKKLGPFFDFFHDGSNDGVLFKYITKESIGMIEELQWTGQEIIKRSVDAKFDYDYVDCVVEHISHPEPKQYVNMLTMLDLMHSDLMLELERDCIGLWRWRDRADSQIKELFGLFLGSRGFFPEKFGAGLFDIREKVLKYKGEESVFYLDREKKIKIKSGRRELAFFTGEEAESSALWILSAQSSFQGNVVAELPAFKKGKTYCFNFVLNSRENLSSSLSAILTHCDSDDVVFFPKQIADNLYALSVVFYAFKDFDRPKLNLKIVGKPPFSIKTKKFIADACSESLEVDWPYRAESKGRLKSPMDSFIVPITGDFSPLWHKVVVKLEEPVDSYEVRVTDLRGELLTSPRIQKGSDFLTVFFRPAIFSKAIRVVFNASKPEQYTYEAVCFYCEKHKLNG